MPNSQGNSGTHFDLFLGRQPIVDIHKSVIGYELLFRNGYALNAEIQNDFIATASVIVQAFSEFGTTTLLGKSLGFINVDEEFLLSDTIKLLPRNQVVLEIIEKVNVTEKIYKRIQELKQLGFTIALDDLIDKSDSRTSLLLFTDLVKIDLKLVDRKLLPDLVRWLKHYKVKLVAEKVDSEYDAILCRQLGFDYLQGFFFSKPLIFTGKSSSSNASRIILLRLMTLILNDSPNGEILELFKQNPNLTYSLMKLVNSVGLTTNHQINSLNQALMILGRKQLERWLQLLLFTNQGKDDSGSIALLQIAATRGRFMELLADEFSELGYSSDQDTAFLVGILSLLDTLVSQPLPSILSQLNLADDIKEALIEHKGELGFMLEITKVIEQNDFADLIQLVKKGPDTMTFSLLSRMYIKATQWATLVSASLESQLQELNKETNANHH